MQCITISRRDGKNLKLTISGQNFEKAYDISSAQPDWLFTKIRDALSADDFSIVKLEDLITASNAI